MGRKSKEITKQSDLDELLSLNYEKTAQKSTIMNYFADFGKGPRFNPYDTIEIPKGVYGKNKKNKNKFKTTVGLWVFNKIFIEDMSDVIGYINEPVTKPVYNSINKKLSYALLENKITLDQLKRYIMNGQILLSCTSALCPSHTMEMLLITKKAEVKKKSIEKKYKDDLAKGDVVAIKKVENELIDFAKEEMKDAESVDIYNSSAFKSSWGNNFKNMYLTRGALKGTDGSYSYASSSFISGMNKDEFANVNDAAVGGPYSRSRKTQEGGYLEKQFTNATQHIKVLPKGSDCGTKRYITVTLTKKNISLWMYSFYLNNGKLTEITSENADKLIGKTIKMRYSGLCEAKDGCICEKCMGTLYNRLNIENVGLGVMIIASGIKRAAMKAFHDSSLNLYEINPDNIFI